MVKLMHIYAYGKYDYDMKYPLNKPVVLCTSTQSERASSKTPIIVNMKLNVSFMETC